MRMTTYAAFFISFLLAGIPVQAAVLGPPVQIGLGGPHAWVTTGPDGKIHVVYNGTYRTGSRLYMLGPEEAVTPLGGSSFANPKIDMSPDGIPRVVYQVGLTSRGTRCQYTERKDGAWITPETFADTAEVHSNRTMLPDVAGDKNGNALVCYWPGKGAPGLGTAVYRWRSPGGTWSAARGDLTTYHAGSPKVEEHNGGFYLHYAASDWDKKLAGSLAPLSVISKTSVTFNSRAINRSYQNEGANFTISTDGTIAAAGNFRNTSSGNGIGVWASDNTSGSFRAEVIADLAGERGDEGHQQPDLVWDEATGKLYVVYLYDGDYKAYYQVKTGSAWSSPARLLPEYEGAQGYFRNGPSVADIPGPGVVVCVSNGSNVYLRALDAPESVSVPSISTGRIEAESMILDGYLVQELTDASGGKGVRTTTSGTAWIRYGGPAGSRDIITGYFDENDGAPDISLTVNGVEVDRWTADDDLGSSQAVAESFVRHTSRGVALNPGDTIMVSSARHDGDLARLDYIEVADPAGFRDDKTRCRTLRSSLQTIRFDLSGRRMVNRADRLGIYFVADPERKVIAKEIITR